MTDVAQGSRLAALFSKGAAVEIPATRPSRPRALVALATLAVLGVSVGAVSLRWWAPSEADVGPRETVTAAALRATPGDPAAATASAPAAPAVKLPPIWRQVAPPPSPLDVMEIRRFEARLAETLAAGVKIGAKTPGASPGRSPSADPSPAAPAPKRNWLGGRGGNVGDLRLARPSAGAAVVAVRDLRLGTVRHVSVPGRAAPARADAFGRPIGYGPVAQYEVRPDVVAAIHEACRGSGEDFAYMLTVAAKESRFDADAASASSSASGLYQFIAQTWLHLVKAHGAKHGLAEWAAKIEQGPRGFVVRSAADRQAVLDLRFDPRANAAMAVEFVKEQRAELAQAIKRQPTPVELYVAHLVGAGTAARGIVLAGGPEGVVVSPEAARANPTLFAEDGRWRGTAFASIERFVAANLRHFTENAAAYAGVAEAAKVTMRSQADRPRAI